RDQPQTKKPLPQPINDRLREELALVGLQGKVCQRQPGTEARRGRGGARALALGWTAFLLLRFADRLYLLRAPRPRRGVIDHLAGQEHQPGGPRLRLGGLELNHAGLALAEEGAGLEGPAKERLHAVVVFLLPVAYQRVVMALGTADVHAEE